VYGYQDLLTDIGRFQRANLRTGAIGRTVLGAPIPYVHIGSPRGGQAVVQAAIHAREHLTAALTVGLIGFTLKNFPRELRSCGIYFIPMVNIDGVRLAQEGADFIADPKRREHLRQINRVVAQPKNEKIYDGFLRTGKKKTADCNAAAIKTSIDPVHEKTGKDFAERLRNDSDRSGDFSLWKASARAADLNCNFPARWGMGAENVKEPAAESWPGPYPASEPETRALIDFTLKVRPKITISYHSKGREIYWRFHQAEPALSRDRRLAEALASATGYRLIDGDRNSAGGYKDWCVETLKIPAFTIEIADDRHAHPVPYSALPEESERNRGVPGIVLGYLQRMNKIKNP
jgi:hypothetical protein